MMREEAGEAAEPLLEVLGSSAPAEVLSGRCVFGRRSLPSPVVPEGLPVS